MANTFTKITNVTVGSGGASTIDFSSIPQTYTDLCIVTSTRMSSSASELLIKFNSSTTSYSTKYLQANGTSVSSGVYTTTGAIYLNEEEYATYTANTFNSTSVYIPNYKSSNYKSFSSDSVTENNATQSFFQFTSGLWSNTSAITNISLTHSSGSFAQYSSATLYGISNS